MSTIHYKSMEDEEMNAVLKSEVENAQSALEAKFETTVLLWETFKKQYGTYNEVDVAVQSVLAHISNPEKVTQKELNHVVAYATYGEYADGTVGYWGGLARVLDITFQAINKARTESAKKQLRHKHETLNSIFGSLESFIRA